jgi:hypothetical protein
LHNIEVYGLDNNTCIHFHKIKCTTCVLFIDDESYREGEGPGQTGLLRWLGSSELLHTLVSSTSELMETMNQVKGKDKGKKVVCCLQK